MSDPSEIRGTRKYLLGAVVCLVLGVWHVKDGWFPSGQTLSKHPSAEDSFYMYNKITGVCLLLGALVSGYIHMVIKD